MPKINRIRIANVSWEKRMILDELYDCFDGEDVLLNLANGGGKSVLVQMMLQPILPTRRIHKRPINDYLSSTSAPTYILIEWKLDNSVRSFYLLTGIAMCAIGQSEEQASRTKYFTFTNYYDEANAYDIKNLPLITHENGGVTFMTYDKARETLRQAKGDSFKLRTFVREESEEYKNSLREYGILPEEWELIAEINDKEGGVDELFSACKTSESLMDRWILKTVSEELSGGSTELHELFLTLMASVLDKEEKYKEKELLEEFAERTDGFMEQLSELCEGLDAAEKAAGELSGLYSYLSAQKQVIEEKKTEIFAKQQEQQEVLKQIGYEEVSEKLFKAQEEHQRSRVRLETAQTELEQLQRAFDDAKQNRESMEAAQHAENRRIAQDRQKSLTEQLDLLRDGRADEDFQRVAFTLLCRYNDAIQNCEDHIASLQDKLISISKTLQDAQERDKENEKTLAADRTEMGGLDERIRGFQSYEEKTLRELSLDLNRNIVGELHLEDVRLAKDELRVREGKALQEQNLLAIALEKNQQKAMAQKTQRETLGQRRESVTRAVELRKREVADFEQARMQRLEILERHGVSSSWIYESEACEKEFLRLAEENQKDLEGVQRRVQATSETLQDCRSGNLHTARLYGELLEEAGIHYSTGETYLSGFPLEEQDAYLQANPMLPYCFLVSKNDLSRLPAFTPDGSVNRVCPVIAYEQVLAPWTIEDRKVEARTDAVRTASVRTDAARTDAARTVVVPPDFRFVCLYNEKSLRADTKETYIRLLEKEIAEQNANRNHLQVQRAQLEADQRTLREGFPYTAQSALELSSALVAAERDYEDVKKQLIALENEVVDGENEAKDLQAKLNSIYIQLETLAEQTRLFFEYLEKDSTYVIDMARRSLLNEEVERLELQLKSIRTSITNSWSLQSEYKSEFDRASRELETFIKSRDALGNPRFADLIESSLPVLEERYQSIVSQRNTDEKRLIADIDRAVGAVKVAEKNLRAYKHLAPELYENLEYSVDRLLQYKEIGQKAESEVNSARNLHTNADVEFRSAERQLQEAVAAVKSIGFTESLPPEQIFGNYETRRRRVYELLEEHKRDLQRCEQIFDELKDRLSLILQYIIPAEVAPRSADWQKNWESLDLPSLGKAYKKAVEKNGKAQTRLQNGLGDLRNLYHEKHPVLTQYLKNIPIDETALTYEAYYFIYERMVEQSTRLRDALTVLAVDLAHLEMDKKNIVHHALRQGKSLYEGLQSLSKSSMVDLWPGTPPRQTLKIGIADVLDGHEDVRMTAYVEQSILTLRSEKEAHTLTEDLLRKRVAALFSDRELLSQVLNTASIPVSLYKVDHIKENSGLRRWEDVLIENSGGELFVSCFVLVSALMSYRRDSRMGRSGVSKTTRAFIIDNPFGKTSSKHLLEAMLRIAKKFRTQMICLSDLSQSSITNRFALIYQLSVRQALYSRNSYLRTDEVRQNTDLHRNERLEHLVLRTPPEQMNLFGE